MSLHKYISADFLLSSTLKPKRQLELDLMSSETAVSRKAKRLVPEMHTKKADSEEEDLAPCSIQNFEKASKAKASGIKTEKQSLAMAQSRLLDAPPESSKVSASERLLHARVQLQIHQREYAHFVECSNRAAEDIRKSLAIIQEIMDEGSRIIPPTKLDMSPSSNARLKAYPSGYDLHEKSALTAPSSPISGKSPANCPPSLSTLTTRSVDVLQRVLPRKPRNLIFAPSAVSNDLMVTSSLDGTIQLWSHSQRRIQSLAYLPAYFKRPYFVESICWLGNDQNNMDKRSNLYAALALSESSASAASSSNTNGHVSEQHVAFLRVGLEGQKPEASIIGPTMPKSADIGPINVVGQWSPTSFISGGSNRNIHLWTDIDVPFKDISVRELHRKHTAAVYSVRAVDQCVWSGGADCRLIGFDVQHQAVTFESKWESRISFILANAEVLQKTLLTCLSARSSQLRLVDVRSGRIVSMFGSQEASNLSRYIRPAWHGSYVAMGSIAGSSAVNIWDLRYLSHSTSPIAVVHGNSGPNQNATNLEESKRFICSEFTPKGDGLVSLSSDASMMFAQF